MQPSEFDALTTVGQDAWATSLKKLISDEAKESDKRLNNITKSIGEQQNQMLVHRDPRSLINQVSR